MKDEGGRFRTISSGRKTRPGIALGELGLHGGVVFHNPGKSWRRGKAGRGDPPHPRQLCWVLLHTGMHNPEHPVSFPSHGPQEKPIPAGSVKPGRLQAAPGREPWVHFVPFPPCSCPQLKLQRDLNPEMLFLALVTPGTLWLCLSL